MKLRSFWYRHRVRSEMATGYFRPLANSRILILFAIVVTFPFRRNADCLEKLGTGNTSTHSGLPVELRHGTIEMCQLSLQCSCFVSSKVSVRSSAFLFLVENMPCVWTTLPRSGGLRGEPTEFRGPLPWKPIYGEALCRLATAQIGLSC